MVEGAEDKESEVLHSSRRRAFGSLDRNDRNTALEAAVDLGSKDLVDVRKYMMAHSGRRGSTCLIDTCRQFFI